jgi:hypothetical protein
MVDYSPNPGPLPYEIAALRAATKAATAFTAPRVALGLIANFCLECRDHLRRFAIVEQYGGTFPSQ